MTTEFLLIVLVPSLTLGIIAWCDSGMVKDLLDLPCTPTPRSSDPTIAAVSLNDDRVLTAQLSGQMRLWSFSKGILLNEIPSHVGPIACVACAPKHELLAVGSKNGQLEVWDLNHSEPLVVRNDPDLEHFHDLEFTPDGLTLMTSGEYGQLIEWDAPTLTRRRSWNSERSNDAVRTLAISSDGRRLLAGNFGGVVQVWDQRSGQRLRSHQISLPENLGDSCVDAVSFISHDSEFIATTRNTGVGVWNVETGALVRRFDGIFRNIKNGVLSPDGSRFVAATMDGELITWSTATGKFAGPVEQLQTTTKALLFSADSRTLLTGDWFGQVLFHRAHAQRNGVSQRSVAIDTAVKTGR